LPGAGDEVLEVGAVAERDQRAVMCLQRQLHPLRQGSVVARDRVAELLLRPVIMEDDAPETGVLEAQRGR
jgi:hypothetical protein